MTDNEIIKALESIASASIGDCKRDCAFYDGKVHFCGGIVAKHSLDIIKRQKAEIERKDRSLESYALQYGTVTDKEVFLRKARAEAIKEFAERLRGMSARNKITGYSKVVYVHDIERTVREMTESDVE